MAEFLEEVYTVRKGWHSRHDPFPPLFVNSNTEGALMAHAVLNLKSLIAWQVNTLAMLLL